MVRYGLVALMAMGIWSAASAQAGDSECCQCEAQKTVAQCNAKAAPAFTLQDQNGNDVSLSDFKGKVVVLQWWNAGCPFIQQHAKAGTVQNLVEKYRDKGVVWLAVNSTAGTNNAANRESVAEYQLNYSILNDAAGKVGKAYDAKTTPHMFVIDKEGKLAYSGAIDNDPQGDKSDRVNYVAKAVDELLAAKPVSIAETKPYGCGVKYAK